jgi:murein DD-endopeptidase MepM/ murein hydrolase activator NlpD
LDNPTVHEGQEVKEGDEIGTSGTTGNAAGLPKEEEHVHFVVRVNGKEKDPEEFMEKQKKEEKKKEDKKPAGEPRDNAEGKEPEVKEGG